MESDRSREREREGSKYSFDKPIQINWKLHKRTPKIKGQRESGHLILAGILTNIPYDLSARVYDINGLCPTITTAAGGGHIPKIEV